MRFGYELENPKRGSAFLNLNSGVYSFHANSELVEGDLVEFFSGGRKCFGLIYDKNVSSHKMKIIGRNVPIAGSINWTTTKNPPFQSGWFDMWGHYKPDFEPNIADDISRVTTAISAPSADVWSLRSIRNSYGSTIRIEYEPDSYSKNVFQKAHSFVVKSIIQLSCQQSDSDNPRGPGQDPDDIDRNPPVGIPENINCTYRLGVHNEGVDLRELFQSGELVDCILPYKYGYVDEFTNQYRVVVDDASLVSVTNVGEDFIEGTVGVKPNSYLYGATIQYYFNKNFAFRGGYRVKSIEVEDNLEQRSSRTSYDYNYGGLSSGVTSFEPDVFDKVMLLQADADIEKHAVSRMGQITDAVLRFARELPSPGVMYQYVTVSETANNGGVPSDFGSRSLYEFRVPTSNMVFSQEAFFSDAYSNPPYQGITYQALRRRNVEIHNFTAGIGKLKRLVLLDQHGAKLSETTYGYLHDLVDFDQTSQVQIANDYGGLLQQFNDQGIVHETIWDARFVRRDNSEIFDLFGIVGKRISYPAVPISEKSINHKTGVVTENQNLSFDFYSGAVTRRLLSDGLGRFYVQEMLPAYRKYPGMGLAPLGGKNMLTQEAQSTTYKVVSATNLTPTEVVSSSVQTWSDQVSVFASGSLGTTGTQSGIWRKKSNYVFIGNSEQAMSSSGLIPVSSFTNFNAWTGGDPGSQWQRTSEITLYDPNSHAIEAKDINDNFAATKFTADNAQVIASAANARYNEFAYSGAEEQPNAQAQFGGGVSAGQGMVVSEKKHTGSNSLKIAPANKGFNTIVLTKSGRGFIQASTWIHEGNANGAQLYFQVDEVVGFGQVIEPHPTFVPVNLSSLQKAGEWYLVNLDVPIPEVNPAKEYRVEVGVRNNGSASIFVDDFRVHPLTGPMTSYVYNSFGELSHILDANNLFTEFRYDAMGRLTQTYRESLLGPGDQPRYGANGISKVSEVQYNYGKNSPYMVNLSVSQTGGSGSLSASGTVAVEQGETQTILIQETCASPQVRRVFVDNVEYPTTASFTLFDGCAVSISPGAIRLANVRAPHDIRVDFNAYNSDAGYRCHMVNVGGGQQCPSGLFEYGTRDQCGNITWVQSSWRGPGTAPNCCAGYSGCNCQIIEN
ncbi:MAG: RHS repeat domain-containing protein [Cyclobacteriaceae bacterium]